MFLYNFILEGVKVVNGVNLSEKYRIFIQFVSD